MSKSQVKRSLEVYSIVGLGECRIKSLLYHSTYGLSKWLTTILLATCSTGSSSETKAVSTHDRPFKQIIRAILNPPLELIIQKVATLWFLALWLYI